MTRNEMLFAMTGKVEIPAVEGAGIKELETALSFNRELSRYGYTLTLDGIMALATHSKEEIKKITDEIGAVLDDAIGISDFTKSQPFYPDFPEQVMATDEAELYLNALIYYMFAQTPSKEMTAIANELRTGLVGEASIEREPLEYDKIKDDLKPLAPAEPAELEKTFYTLIQGPNLSESQYTYLKEYAKVNPEWQAAIFRGHDMDVPSHETLTKLAMISYEQGNIGATKQLLSKAEDVLRFAAVLSGNKDEKRASYMDANLSFGIKNNKKLFKFTNHEKTFIKGLLEDCKDLYYSIWQREAMWKKIMPRLDTKDARFPRVTGAFDNLSKGERQLENGRPVPESAHKIADRICEMFKQHDERAITELNELARRYPAVFGRYIERFAHAGAPALVLAENIREHMRDVPVFTKLKLAEFIEKSDEWDYRIATNKKGHSVAIPNNREPLPEETKTALIAALEDSVKEELKSPEPLPARTIYIDQELEDRKLPLRDARDASMGATLTKYSEIDCRDDKNIVAFGIFWRNAGEDRADIDLGARILPTPSDWKEEDVYYGNLKNSWGVHSGDYTTGVIAPELNGAVEYIFIDKEKLKEVGAQYLMPSVHGFNRPFSEADSVRFMFMEKSGNLDMLEGAERDEYGSHRAAPTFDGEIINPSEIGMSYRLTQNSNMATPFIYDVENEKFIWLDSTLQLSGIPNVANLEGQSKSALQFYEALHNDYPDMARYAMLYAQANELEIVRDVRGADIICSATPVDKAADGIRKEVVVIEPYSIYRLTELHMILAQREAEREAKERAEELQAEEAQRRQAEEARRQEEEAAREEDKQPDILSQVAGAVITAGVLHAVEKEGGLKAFINAAIKNPAPKTTSDKDTPDFHDD